MLRQVELRGSCQRFITLTGKYANFNFFPADAFPPRRVDTSFGVHQAVLASTTMSRLRSKPLHSRRKFGDSATSLSTLGLSGVQVASVASISISFLERSKSNGLCLLNGLAPTMS